MKRSGYVTHGITIGLAATAVIVGFWAHTRPSGEQALSVEDARPVATSEPDAPLFSEVEPWGQDIDGDGIASTAEGEFDADGDGEFTQVEAGILEMDCYIHWMPQDKYASFLEAEAQGYFFENRVCASACMVFEGGFICISNLVTVNCIEDGGICWSVPCGGSCHCPP